MAMEEALRSRILGLVDEAKPLSIDGTEWTFQDDNQRFRCAGWFSSAMHVIEQICPSADQAYRVMARRIADQSNERVGIVPSQVGQLSELLSRLLTDVEAGLLVSVANLATADVFDDLLVHAEQYLKDKRLDVAGVIAGVAFEDTLRKIGRKYEADDTDKVDKLIASLNKEGHLSKTQASRARAAATVRNAATHANWQELDLEGIRATIGFTRELIGLHLEQ